MGSEINKKRLKNIGIIIVILGFTTMLPQFLFTLGYMAKIGEMYSQVIRIISFSLIILGSIIYSVAKGKVV